MQQSEQPGAQSDTTSEQGLELETAPDAQAPVRTSRELWQELRKRAGLSLSDQGRVPYDDEIVEQLRSALVEGKAGDLADLLDQYEVPIERLLTHFLRAAAPFARMMSDVLVMFETAAARRTDRNLKLALDVANMTEPLEFDLQNFRDVVTRVTRSVRMVSRLNWNVHDGWAIPRLFNDSPLSQRLVDTGESAYDLWPRSADVCSWLEQMSHTHRFPDLPPAPHSGDVELDDLIGTLWSDFQAFQGAARELFQSYAAIAAIKVPDEFEGWDASMLRASHDFWPRESVRVLAILAEAIAADPNDGDARALVDQIAEFIATISMPPIEVETLEQTLEDLFNLPVWQKRHELYSVWIAAIISKALAPHSVVFHPNGDTLSFPFRKTHLATIGAVRGHRLELWSELRTPAADLIGRKDAVQPDYRLRFESSNGPGEGNDFFVTECKQYRRSSTKNFSEALTDYGKAAPDAIVTLVNYGPVGDAVLKRLPQDVAEHCHAFGHVRPGGEGLPVYNDLLVKLGQGVFAWAPKPRWHQDQIWVELKWGSQTDLDLHVTTANASCGFDHPQGLPEARFGQDDRGTSPGPHSETIVITPEDSERFHVIVHAFSEGLISDSEGATVFINWCSDDQWRSQSVPLDQANAREWHVATFVKGEDAPTIVNRRADGFVTGDTPGWEPAPELQDRV